VTYLEHMALWLRIASHVVLEGKFPTSRRVARWRANWEFDQVLRSLKPADIAIDCGANVGKFTEKMAATGATVYAFEPDPVAFKILQDRLANKRNVVLFNSAVGVDTKSAMLFHSKNYDLDPERQSISSSIFENKSGMNPNDGVIVDQIDFIEFIGNLPKKIALLKLDIEGAEVNILDNLIKTNLITKIIWIFAETHEKQIPDLRARTKYLKSIVKKEGLTNINLDWQ